MFSVLGVGVDVVVVVAVVIFVCFFSLAVYHILQYTFVTDQELSYSQVCETARYAQTERHRVSYIIFRLLAPSVPITIPRPRTCRAFFILFSERCKWTDCAYKIPTVGLREECKCPTHANSFCIKRIGIELNMTENGANQPPLSLSQAEFNNFGFLPFSVPSL